ncbi:MULTISPECIES: UDP-glucose 4-epimerase family protein [Pseudomonas]|uniref:UDP-glucose 4-epimerase family protein n=1 Tax=unclassified Pseudomonas TaxID=196821 RepID=UPI000C87C359|nr:MULTISPECIES: SDR family oxidoreductase [unclassified Pseudomonas]PMU87763.1 NAD-dependent dehydratase [Pseudomonas sp. GW704-F3]PMU92927.1 NAD-dependent dehydratase [Pseudomonas sp. GW704-F5]PMV02556.1 NAD-dependent dehydratase [Pseudomonas sp. MPBD4-3]PMV27013.1 NAD-dependent dehydratase [Pseudomonas sp. GW704-F2]
MTRILVTGGSGFVGKRLIEKLMSFTDGHVRAIVRRVPAQPAKNVVYHHVPDFSIIDADLDALKGAEVVIHLASRVHVMNDTEVDPLAAFRLVNVGYTLKLARSAAMAGAKRFIFVSSVKVNGEGTVPGHPYRETDVPAPVDPYGVSKMEAEAGLRLIAAETDLEVVIIRPVLVYGPGVTANFESMMKWLQRGIPLPFGAIRNQRSLVALDNLVDFIITCVSHPAACDQTFLVSDGEDVSTTQLLQKLANVLNSPARLLSVPEWVLKAGAKLLGKTALSQRLCDSLQVDITKARRLLEWSPVITVDQGLRKTADHFLNERTK